MNSLCFDRGNSVCWWRFPNASGPREGLPCGSTQGVFPDQDFSPQCGPQGRDLCQRVEEGLEGRTRPPTRLTCKRDCQSLMSVSQCCLRCFYISVSFHLPTDNQVSSHPSESRVGTERRSRPFAVRGLCRI